MKTMQIRYSVKDGVALIVLNRPERLNACTRVMLIEIMNALDAADSDPDVRVVIVTGEGKAFCAGFELSGVSAFSDNIPADEEAGGDPERDMGGQLTLRIFASLKPIIGAVNGAAVGIGATMLLPMDYRIAVDNARFGFAFTRLGIVPEAASSWFLPRLVGIARSLDWTLSGRMVSTEAALQGGLVSALHPRDTLLDAAYAIAAEIIENTAPVSTALTRQLMWQGLTVDHPMEMHCIDSRLLMMRGASADAQEGVGSFLEKRVPRFPDRVPEDLPDFCPWREPPRFSQTVISDQTLKRSR